MQLKIKASNGTVTDVEVSEDVSVVSELKTIIEAATSVPAQLQRLIYKGRILKDDGTLESYAITDGQTIHIVKGANGSSPAAASPAAATATNLAVPAAPSAATATMNAFAQPGVAPAGNPFAALAGMGGGTDPFGGMGSLASLGGFGGGFGGGNLQQMQEQLMQNPQAMQQIMNSPMMESLMSNPEMMRQMILGNPQLQAMMDANPQVRQALTDPGILRQTMEAMRNPQAMQQMMRSQDLAMSQLENLPGGFNALRRMYEDISEPMYDALSSTQNSSSPSNSAPSVSSPPSTTPNTQSLPNPWGAPQPSSASAPGFGAGMPGSVGFPGMGGGGFPGMGGMGGFPGMGGMGGLGGLPPGMGDPQQLAAMMQQPGMQQMLQNMLNDPAMVQRMSAMNPQLGQALSNPQVRAMLGNPQMMQAIMQMQAGMGGAGAFGGNPGANPFGAFGQPAGGAQGLDFSSLLAGSQGGGLGGFPPVMPTAAAATATPQVDPAVQYASQLQQLQDMGFSDNAANIRALVATRGNVNSAVERLFQ